MGQWHNLFKADSVKPGCGVQSVVEGKVLAVFNIEGTFYAIDDTCTHAGASLAEGSLAGPVVTCPWHGATFDVATGEALSDPAYEGVKTYHIKVENDNVFVEL